MMWKEFTNLTIVWTVTNYDIIRESSFSVTYLNSFFGKTVTKDHHDFTFAVVLTALSRQKSGVANIWQYSLLSRIISCCFTKKSTSSVWLLPTGIIYTAEPKENQKRSRRRLQIDLIKNTPRWRRKTPSGSKFITFEFYTYQTLSRNKFPKGFINLKVKWHYLHRALSIFLGGFCRLSEKGRPLLE